MKIRIDNGRLIDPAVGLDAAGSLCVAGGSIVAAGAAPRDFQPDTVIDAAGRWICPGVIDLSVRFAGSGAAFRSGLAGETAAAAAAGVTSVCCPPDTSPVMDTPAVVELIHHAGDGAGYTRVYPVGALTMGLGGERLAEMHALKLAGCIAIGNANEPILNNEILRRALEYAASTDLTVFLHAEDHHLSNRGVVNEGAISTRLGLAPVPATAETVAVAAALLLVEQINARVHFCRLTTARAVEMVGRAKQYGLPVTADAGICHLYLTEQDVDGYDANCHLIPPLRREEDRAALVQGLADGVIDAVCSDHQPLGNDAKLTPFNLSRPGASTVEALLPLMLDLVHKGVFTPAQALEKLTVNPGRILGLTPGLSPGRDADIIIVDPDEPWTLQAHKLRSAGKNTPFDGWELQGRATHTILGGKLVYSGGRFAEGKAAGMAEE